MRSKQKARQKERQKEKHRLKLRPGLRWFLQAWLLMSLKPLKVHLNLRTAPSTNMPQPSTSFVQVVTCTLQQMLSLVVWEEWWEEWAWAAAHLASISSECRHLHQWEACQRWWAEMVLVFRWVCQFKEVQVQIVHHDYQVQSYFRIGGLFSDD